MLPQVGSTLKKFVPPIASAKKSGGSNSESASGSGLQYSGDDFQHEKINDILTDPIKIEAEKKPPKKQPPLNAKPGPPLTGVTASFIQLLNSLQENSGNIVKWLAPKTYQESIRRQKKSSKFRKGMVVDDKID